MLNKIWLNYVPPCAIQKLYPFENHQIWDTLLTHDDSLIYKMQFSEETLFQASLFHSSVHM